MSKVVDVIGRAIYEARNGAGALPFNHLRKEHRAPYLLDAGTALRAMRDAPDEFLLAAGEPYQGQVDRVQGTQMRREALNRMIDEALK